MKACAVLIPLLGVTWLFGILLPLHKAFVYIFTILNSTQVSVESGIPANIFFITMPLRVFY